MRPFVEGATKHFLTLAVGLTVIAYRLLAGAIDGHKLCVLVKKSDFVLLLDLLNILFLVEQVLSMNQINFDD